MTADTQGYRDRKMLEFLIEKKHRLKRHILFLTVFFLILYGEGIVNVYGTPFGYYVALTIYIIFVIMFYVNMYILIPKLLFRSKYILYAICLILLAMVGIQVMGYFQINHFDAHKLIQNGVIRQRPDLYGVIILCASLISVSTTIKLLQRWLKDNERISELKNITFNMEMDVLKNQISPHFLFNMLNNVKALIRTNPEMANTVIIRLSEFLRYQLYENSGEKTLLASEVEFISNFLNLEKIRKDNFEIETVFTINKNSLNSIFIPPGLFTVFIENAIKHSINPNGDKTYVKTYLQITEGKLNFKCINSISIETNNTYKNKSNGLGLINIKRRLELLYKDKYQLEITKNQEEYCVNLTIPL